MTLQNIANILLPKEQDKTANASDQKPAVLTINPDEARTRRNRLAALCGDSKILKKAA